MDIISYLAMRLLPKTVGLVVNTRGDYRTLSSCYAQNHGIPLNWDPDVVTPKLLRVAAQRLRGFGAEYVITLNEAKNMGKDLAVICQEPQGSALACVYKVRRVEKSPYHVFLGFALVTMLMHNFVGLFLPGGLLAHCATA